MALPKRPGGNPRRDDDSSYVEPQVPHRAPQPVYDEVELPDLMAQDDLTSPSTGYDIDDDFEISLDDDFEIVEDITPAVEEYRAPVVETPEVVEPVSYRPESTPVVERYTEPVDETDEEETSDEADDEETDDTYETFTPEDWNAARALLELLNDSRSSEVLMNNSKTILYKQAGQRIHAHEIQFSSTEAYHQFIDDIILAYTDASTRIRSEEGGTAVNENYLIEGQLTLPPFEEEDSNLPPLLARVHVVAPPVVQEAIVTIAKKSRYQLTLNDIQQSGALTAPMADFLKAIMRGRATTVFSGLSGSGKTTLLEALSHEFDANDRIIVVEDTPELRLPLTDVVYLNSTPPKPGLDPAKVVPLEWLVASANRMRPTRVIVGEVRGAEMGEFLIAANSGADGSMTTMHASTPQSTLEKMISLSMKSVYSKSETSVARDIASTVQIIVQMTLIDGQHVITEIQEVTRAVRKETNGIVTQTLFQYDKDRGVHRPVQRPTAELTSFLNQRGVDVDASWFRGIV